METAPKYLTGLEPCGSRRGLSACLNSWNHMGALSSPLPVFLVSLLLNKAGGVEPS
jgi:hypothetical protein